MFPASAHASQQAGARPRLHWRHFIAAPHRMFFFGGVWALVLSVLWWAAVLLAAPIAVPAPHWFHGWLMVFCAIPFFVFGFLLTALPRWLGTAPIPAAFYRPAALALMAGFVLAIVGALWYPPVAIIGMGLSGLAWLASLGMLVRRLLQSTADSKLHPLWAVAALIVGLLAALMAIRATLNTDILSLRLAPQVGLWAFLAPMVFVVAHRMVPFFASLKLDKDYQLVRPRWAPPVVVPLLWAHAAMLLAGAGEWQFIVDTPLLLITTWLLLRWQPWRTRHEPLLWTLFVGFAWLPIAIALSLAQSLMQQFADSYFLGLAPLHALAIGLAASMVFAMATRVSMGHSGRPLHMPRFAVICFLILQLAVITRIGAELNNSLFNRNTWLILSTVLWLCAFTPWALRLSWMYWQPRIDGRPG